MTPGVHWSIRMLMEMSHTEVAPGVVAVTLTGKLMMGQESERIVTLVDELMRAGKRIVIFDMAGVAAIDSTGVGRFISTYNKLAAVGGEMRMAGATGHVFQTFHVSLLDKVFRFFPTVDDAAKA
jgi:anti-sigma B factor antagonist